MSSSDRKRPRVSLASSHAIFHSCFKLLCVVLALLPVTIAFLSTSLQEMAITPLQHSKEQVQQKRRRRKDDVDFLMTGTHNLISILLVIISFTSHMRYVFLVHRYGLDTCKEETEISKEGNKCDDSIPT